MLTPKYSEIEKIISVVYEKLNEFVEKDETVLVLYVYKSSSINNIKSTIFSKKDFVLFLRDTQVKPFGFIKYQDIPVIILGENSDLLFAETKKNETFEWLKFLAPLKKDEFYIPNRFDSPTWRYEFINEKFDFKGIEYWSYED